MRALSRTCLALLAAALLPVMPALAAPPLDFDRDVKPIFEQNCFKCHGPEKQKGGLRLDRSPAPSRVGIWRAGGGAGEPGEESLLELVTTNDPDQAMPPKGDRLKPEQVAILQQWIETGALGRQPRARAGGVTRRRPGPPDHRAGPAVLVVRPAAPRRAAGDEVIPVWARHRIDSVRARRMEQSRAHTVRRRGRSGADPPRHVRPDRPAADARRRWKRSSPTSAPTRTSGWWIGCSHLRAFGERMASLWLPLARYAEDQAHQVGSDTKFFYPNACKYRAVGDRRLQPRPALRPVRPASSSPPTSSRWRSAGRPGGAGVPRAGAEVLQPRSARGDGGRVGGPRRYRQPDDARADGRLRPLPRSQVRPDLAGATITRWPACSPARSW